MPKINTTNGRKFIYHVRHNYLTINNIVVVAAFLVAASWVWGSLSMMQRNYGLQRDVDAKRQQLELTQLQRDNLALQKKYYQTAEYQELAVRSTVGLVLPGEKVLILPKNSDAALQADAPATVAVADPVRRTNIEQWVNFLFGGNSRSLRSDEQADA